MSLSKFIKGYDSKRGSGPRGADDLRFHTGRISVRTSLRSVRPNLMSGKSDGLI